MMQQKKFSKRLNYDVINSLFSSDVSKAKVNSYSDSEDGRSMGNGSHYRSDGELTDALEEEGDAVPTNHPSVRKRSRLEQRDRVRKNKARAKSSAGEESEAERGVSRPLTDGETDTEANNWKAGLNFPFSGNDEDDYGDMYDEDGAGLFE